MANDDSNSGGPPDTDDEYDDSVPPIWQTVIDLGASLPPEEWDRLPKDFAANLKRYLYGGSGKGD